MEPIVRVYSSTGFRLSIEIDLKSTVEDLKLAVAEICGRPVEQQRLIYKGRLMKNDQTLESYGTASESISLSLSLLCPRKGILLSLIFIEEIVGVGFGAVAHWRLPRTELTFWDD